MEDTRYTFETRCTEIAHYMDFIIKIEPERTYIGTTDSSLPDENRRPSLIDNETKKILKANVYLLLYNLTESTVRNALQAIYRHFHSTGISFHEVRDEVQQEILLSLQRFMNKNDVIDFSQRITDISKDIVHMTLNATDRFNGNVDARVIRESVRKMGFTVVTDAFARDGVDLQSIKSQRNSLAHGELSFSDCGKDLVANDLKSMFERTKCYLSALIDCSEQYLLQEQYKKA